MSDSPRYMADFDSAATMARVLAAALRGKVYRNMGMPAFLRPLAAVANHLPRRLRQEIYAAGGLLSSASPGKLDRFDPETISRWVCGLYPEARYPCVFVGASNGAALHLAEALGAPWLPQTWLVPVRRRSGDIDDAEGELERMKPLGRALVDRHPDIALHHMHDANQDRLMIRYMSYFRVKWRSVGAAYRAFLERVLAPGATIFLIDCRLRWPVTRVAPRYVFQHGGAGGLPPDEATSGDSPRIREFLQRQHARRRSWSPPPPDTTAPEAEWGSDPAFEHDLRTFAEGRYQVRRLSFDEPEALSPFVADLLADWYRRSGRSTDTLLIDSFILLDPGLARRMAAVPLWTKFNVETARESVLRFLSDRPPYDRIGLTLFANGLDSIGSVPVTEWQRRILGCAREQGRLIGIDPRAYPADLAIYFRYARALEAMATDRAAPPLLPVDAVPEFAAAHSGAYAVALDT